MNKAQLGRWKQFSIGLARAGWPTMTEARRQRLAEEVEEFIDNLVGYYPLRDIRRWDGYPGVCVGSEAEKYFSDRHYHSNMNTDREYGNRFLRQVTCCIRAGFDVAVEPSGGVLGFTVGDVRRIFDQHLPTWVANFFEPPLNGSVPDDEPVWL